MKYVGRIRRCDLCNLDETPKCRCVQNSVSVALGRTPIITFGNLGWRMTPEVSGVRYIPIVDHSWRNAAQLFTCSWFRAAYLDKSVRRKLNDMLVNKQRKLIFQPSYAEILCVKFLEEFGRSVGTFVKSFKN